MKTLLLGVVLCVTACGPATEMTSKLTDGGTASSSTDENEMVAAKEHAITAGQVVTVIDQLSVAVDVLGIIPEYQCGESRRTFLGRVMPEVESDLGCVSIATKEEEPSDVVVMSFVGSSCTVRGHKISGDIIVTYTGGEDRFDMVMDVSKATIDGVSIPAQVGYGTCGDETRYSAKAKGTVAGSSTAYDFALQVGVRDGLPIIGSKSFVFDGAGTLTRGAAADVVTLTAVEYSLGDVLPSKGTIGVDTAAGTSVVVKFDSVLWRLGTAQITVDANSPVTVPIVR